MSPTVFQEYTTRPVDCIPETGTYITHNATDWRKFDQITYSFFWSHKRPDLLMHLNL